jgi:hypothetical protein
VGSSGLTATASRRDVGSARALAPVLGGTLAGVLDGAGASIDHRPSGVSLPSTVAEILAVGSLLLVLVFAVARAGWPEAVAAVPAAALVVALGVESPTDALAQIRRLLPVVRLLAALLVMGEAVPIAGTIPKGAKFPGDPRPLPIDASRRRDLYRRQQRAKPSVTDRRCSSPAASPDEEPYAQLVLS